MIRFIREKLRIEEFFYALFFLCLFSASCIRGEWYFRLYSDRFTYFFGILLILIISWRFHAKLFRMATLEFETLNEDLEWIFFVSRDIFNLYMCLVMYSSLAPFLEHLPVKDGLIVRFEKWFFGGNPLLVLERLIHPALTKAMVVAYLSFFFYLPILILNFLRNKREAEMRELMASLSFALVVGYGGYVLVPAVGPAVFQENEFSVSIWKEKPGVFREALKAVDENRIKKDCFPSMHTCISTLCLVFAFRYSKRLFFLFLPGIVGLIFSTVYLRYHYVSDCVAGIFLAVLAAHIGPIILRKWKSF